MYTITELTEKLSVPRNTLYDWVKKFNRFLSPDVYGSTPNRNQRNRRMFTDQDLALLAKVRDWRAGHLGYLAIHRLLEADQPVIKPVEPKLQPLQAILPKVTPVISAQSTIQTPLEPLQAAPAPVQPVIIAKPVIIAPKPIYSPGNTRPDLIAQPAPGSATARSAPPAPVEPIKVVQFKYFEPPPISTPIPATEQTLPSIDELAALIRAARGDVRRVAFEQNFNEYDLSARVRECSVLTRLVYG